MLINYDHSMRINKRTAFNTGYGYDVVGTETMNSISLESFPNT